MVFAHFYKSAFQQERIIYALETYNGIVFGIYTALDLHNGTYRQWCQYKSNFKTNFSQRCSKNQ